MKKKTNSEQKKVAKTNKHSEIGQFRVSIIIEIIHWVKELRDRST